MASKHVFGLCGHTNIAVLSAMANSSIRFVTVRHEQIAAHAADAYARVTGKASVLLTHLSPGLTNAATGVANAALDCIPMVVIAGDVPSFYYGKHPHQEVNLHADGSQSEIYRPFVKRAWRVDRADLSGDHGKGVRLGGERSARARCWSTCRWTFSRQRSTSRCLTGCATTPRRSHPRRMDEDVAERIVRALIGERHPVIYAGGGVLLAKAADELREFVDHLGIPVAHSLMGKGALPDDHPLVLGMTGFWGAAFVNRHA